MAGPLYALYELSVILSAFVHRWKKKREQAEARRVRSRGARPMARASVAAGRETHGAH